MAKTRQHTIHDGRDLPIQIDTAIIDRYAEQIGVYGIAVYVALARFAKRDNTTVLAYQTIADVLGMARSTAQNTIKKLVDAGLISSEQQTDDAGNPIASNRYTLLPIKHSKAEHGEGGYRDTVGGVPSNGYIVDSISTLHDSPTPTAPQPIGGGGEYEKEVRRLLAGQNIMAGRQIAEQYAQLDPRPDIETIRQSIENLLDPSNPRNLAQIARRLQDDPPISAPYPKPTKALGSGGPSNGHVPVPKNALQGEALREAALKLRKPKT